jgi:hypothetical protein
MVSRERFIQQQHGGIAGECSRYGDALLLTAGERRRPPIGEVAKSDKVCLPPGLRRTRWRGSGSKICSPPLPR